MTALADEELLDAPPIDLPAVERRTAHLEATEVSQTDDAIVLEGHAAVFDTESNDIGGFTESIKRGAFKKVLRSNPDVLFLALEHELPPLARTSVRSGPGSLKLSEGPKGLEFRAELVNTTAARDTAELIRTGVVSETSFGWKRGTVVDQWAKRTSGRFHRTITEFKSLLDITAAVIPVYPGTDISKRAMACGIEIVDPLGDVQEQILRDLAWKIHRGDQDATVEERAAVDAAFARIDTVSPWIAERAFRAASQEPELRAAVPGKRATVTLEDAESGETVAYRLAARKRRLRALGHIERKETTRT